jgi:dTDP-3-amino-3,4,6-trideoxy-alpha-D-glucose transaminase
MSKLERYTPLSSKKASLGRFRAPAEVPFVSLQRQHAALEGQLDAAYRRVVGASGFILGEEVEAFEREFASYCGTARCVGVSSGTAAITIALLAAGIGPGDEVIVPAHTFAASALAVLHAGAVPVLCDVEADTGLIDADSAAQVVSDRTAAVLPVHLYGQACDMAAIGELASRHGLLVVEDAAQAHGAAFAGRRAGALGDVAAFSFYPSKNLGALGDGGAICTGDETIAARARELRNLGQRRKGEHARAGFNERLDGLQAAFLRAKLPHLDAWNAARRSHADAYREGLPAAMARLAERSPATCVYHLFPVRVSGRDRAGARLAEAGVSTGIHYSPPLHRQPALKGACVVRTDLDRADAWARDELSLPMFAEMTRPELDFVIHVCAGIFSGESAPAIEVGA